jgi:hypothetical protein
VLPVTDEIIFCGEVELPGLLLCVVVSPTFLVPIILVKLFVFF